jgi:DNA-binding beta-propeller fold protein YncE
MRGWKDLLWLSIVTFSLLISSCSAFQVQSYSPEDGIFYPQPPDSARIQYITSINNSSDIQGKQSPFSRFVFGEATPLSMERPGSLHAAGGKIFICDASVKGLIIIDLVEKSFNKFIPTGRGELQTPLSCFADTLSGKLYVADGQRMQVLVYDMQNELKYITAFTSTTPYMPTGIAVNEKNIYVLDRKNHNVRIYDKNTYKEINSFPDINRGKDGFLYSPSKIVANDNSVYVSDFGDFNIKVYDIDGNFTRTVGTYGNFFGQFFRIKGITVDKQDRLFAVDAAYENVQIFNDQGQVLMFFGGRNNNAGDMILPKDVTLDYHNVKYFKDYIDPEYNVAYLIWVTCQYGSNKLQVYGMIEY